MAQQHGAVSYQLLRIVTLTLFMGMPCVVIVTVCLELSYETTIEPENQPPVIDKFMRRPAMRPLASPEALKVSSHVPETLSA